MKSSSVKRKMGLCAGGGGDDPRTIIDSLSDFVGRYFYAEK